MLTAMASASTMPERRSPRLDCPALLVAAPASGEGKTTVTAGLARLHRRQGRRVRVFKSGPDFLDPTVLQRAARAPVYNLDLWMGGDTHCRALLHQAARKADLILVEGVMGLYDGDPSAADLAVRFGLPVLCVIDATAMAQTFAALAVGLAGFQPGLAVAGLLANRVAGSGHRAMLAERLPAGLPLLGTLPRDPGLELPHRHLGLWQADEVADLDARLDAVADALVGTALAELPAPVSFLPSGDPEPIRDAPLAGLRIAVARDLAFAFLYAANLDWLRAAGAAPVFFSPLADRELPACDALYLPGGYPELHLEQLAANASMKAAIRAHHAAGRPILAECGGLLYLLDSLAGTDGNPAPMVGLLPGRARMRGRLANLGLQQVDLPEGTLRGHTFHHSEIETELTPLVLTQPLRQHGRPEGAYRIGRLTASYLHLYFPSNPQAVARLFIP
jgi:cobyrinic acid a,c-diamide synthase